MKKSIAHQLIIFYGSSPGAGKSTLSAFLAEQLRLHGIPVSWLYEEDLLYHELFQVFVQDIRSGNRRLIDSLLAASTDFVSAQLKGERVVITDSIFPCFNWLIATGFYTHEQIEACGRRLEQVLHPLKPLVIYLEVEQKRALQRAVEQRGRAWLAEMLVVLNSYGCNQDRPLQNVEEVAAYFKMAGDLSLQWLKGWQSEVLILDANQHSISELRTAVLERMALEEIRSVEIRAGPASLQVLTGTYYATEEAIPLNKHLRVELLGEVLKVNTYWPKGCELVAEGKHQFRLKDTSHRICFEGFQDGIPQELSYDNQGGVYRYRRMES